MNDISVTKVIQKMEEGWFKKPKGMLQILWERGFIDTEKVSQYTLNGPQDIYGSIDKNFNLIYLMTQQYDFAHESTMLQHIGNELGVIVDRTPKCHPEMAGEGIEYSWGCAKNRYRALPLAEKKSKAKFLENVRLCMSRDYITAERVRLFS